LLKAVMVSKVIFASNCSILRLSPNFFFWTSPKERNCFHALVTPSMVFDRAFGKAFWI